MKDHSGREIKKGMLVVGKERGMKDHFGREIKEGMLVVGKATGQMASMSHGIANGSGRIRYSQGYTGFPSDQVIIDTDHDHGMELIRIGLIESFKREDAELAEHKAIVKASLIKNKDFKVLGVYSNGADDYYSELYLGKCSVKVGGKTTEFDNCWLRVQAGMILDSLAPDNVEIPKRYYNWGYNHGKNKEFNMGLLRECKQPKKTIEMFVLTPEQWKKMIEASGYVNPFCLSETL